MHDGIPDLAGGAIAPVSIAALQGLARAVGLDQRLVVVVGEEHAGWSLDPHRGEIRCDPVDLRHAHPDDVRGLVCHEAAHAAVTRYPLLVPGSLLSAPGMAPLLNALEDCRIEAWLQRRFPGTAAWIRRTNDRLVPVSLAAVGEQPWAHQFCIGAIMGWWQESCGEPVVWPEALAPEVVDALRATEEARARVVAAQPPVDVLAADGSGYAGSLLARRFASADAFRPPDPFERAVRLAAWSAWQVVHQDIRPVYLELVHHDLAERPELAEEERSFVRRLRGLAPGGFGQGAIRGAGGAGGGVARGALARAARGELEPDHDSPYERARRRVAPWIEATCRSLLPLVTRARMPTWGGAHASGGRVDVRRVMQAQADPRRRDRLWQRKTLPVRHDPVVHLLVDLSGSMAGDRIEVAFAGVVLLCEVLHQLRIPFAVSGFQDRTIPVKGAADPLDMATRQRIGDLPLEVLGQRPGGNNRPEHNHDGPVLLETARALWDHPARERWLWVVSDGLPTGPADGVQPLHDAVAAVVLDGSIGLVGIGLGPGTDHVGAFYPEALPEVPLEELPASLGALVDRLVGSL